MTTTTIAIGLLAGSILLVFWLVNLEYEDLGEEDREYKDPLPPFLRAIWPLVRWADRRIAVLLPAGMYRQVEKKLAAANVTHLIDVGQFAALKIVSALLMTSGYGLVAWMLGSFDFIFLLVAVVVGFLMPDSWLSDIRKLYVKKVGKELPTLLDFMTLALESGQNLGGAIRLSIDKSPQGVLRQEMTRVMRDISAGVARSDALFQMQERIDVKEITMMVAAIIQAERMGTSLGPVLREQATQRRTERFLRAEKKAFEAPVKMIAPLVIFIFPCTFAFLGYFLYQKVAGSGAF